MRALRFLTLAAALIIPAAAAHAQVGVYVGPRAHFVRPAYGQAYIAPQIITPEIAPGVALGYWAYGPQGRYWVAPHRREVRGWYRR